MLLEDAESDSQKKAIKYLMDKEEFTKEEAELYVRKTLREKFRLLTNNRKVGKFTLGVLRLYIEECDSENDIKNLNSILNAISEDNSIGTKYDRNFNGKHLEELFKEIDPKEYKIPERKSVVPKDSKYKVYRIDSFDEAQKFSPYVSWCITKSVSALDSYSSSFLAQFYFAVKEGFEDMKSEDHGNEELLGEYGLSMLAICINPNGSLKSCTCRWNHNKGGNDHCMNAEEIEKVVGFNFYDAFPPNPNSKNILAMINDLEIGIKNGYSYDDCYRLSKTKYLDIGTTTHYYDSNFVSFNISNIYSYLFDKRGNFIVKTGCDEGNKYVLDGKIIYKDIKTNKYVLYDYHEDTKTRLNGLKDVEVFDGFSWDEKYSHLLSLKYEDGTKIYDNEFDEILNLNDVEGFKSLKNITSCEDENCESISYLDIKFVDKNNKERWLFLDCREGRYYIDRDLNSSNTEGNFIILNNTEGKGYGYSVLTDYHYYPNVIGVNDACVARYQTKYKIVSYSTNGSSIEKAIFEFGDYDNEISCIGDDFKDVKYQSLSDNIDYIAWSNDGEYFDVHIYNTDDDIHEEIDYYKNVEILETYPYYDQNESRVSMMLRDENGKFYFVDDEGMNIDMDNLQEESDREVSEYRQNLSQDDFETEEEYVEALTDEKLIDEAAEENEEYFTSYLRLKEINKLKKNYI